MAEILLRVVDKVNPDLYLNAGLLHQYDVVTIQDDFWEWSTEERTSPDWVIIKAPLSTIEELASFLQPELPPLDNPTKPCWRRLYYLNPDAPYPAASPSIDGVRILVPGTDLAQEPYRIEKLPYPDPVEL